jgi:hypothetical protein
MSALPDPRVSVYPVPARHGTCRLQLSIGKSVYTLIPPHGPAPLAWGVKQIRGASPGARYSCYVTPSGHPACSCPDHQHRATVCKHLGALRACGLLSFADPGAPPKRKRSPKSKALPPAAPASEPKGVAV